MPWTPRPLHSQVYPWAKGVANAKAAATQVPWQNSAQGHGFSYLTLLQCSFSQAAPNCCPAPGSVKHSSYSQGHHIFHLATTSDLAITWCTTYPSPSTCFLHNGKVLEPKFPFLHKDWCSSCWDFNRWWVSYTGFMKVFSRYRHVYYHFVTEIQQRPFSTLQFSHSDDKTHAVYHVFINCSYS